MPGIAVYPSMLERKLEEIEAGIARNSYETAILLDQNGKVLFSKAGTKRAVRFSKDDLRRMRGNILTHNHPFDLFLEEHGVKNISAFSSIDLLLAYQQKPNEIRMAVSGERHSFQWTGANKQEACDLLTKLELLESASRESIIKIAKKLRQGAYKAIDNYCWAYYITRKKYVDKIDALLEANGHIGYIYRRRR